MKKALRLLSLLLCFVIALTSLVSCGESIFESDKDANDSSNSSGKLQGTTVIDESKYFVLFKDGAYTSKFVIPDMASTAESAVYAKLRSAVKEKISADVAYATDHLSAGQTRDPNESAVLIGNTNYDESKQIFEKQNYGDYSISIVNNKLVLSFITKDDGISLVDTFVRAIKTDNNGSYWIERSFSYERRAIPQLEGIPKYPSAQTTLVESTNNTSMVVASSTTIEEFKSYCTALEKDGFTLYASRDNVNQNCFRTYIKDDMAVNAYFTPYTKSARIVVGPSTDVPPTEKDTTPEIYTPSLTLISQGSYYNNGLGMVYLLPNGKFLIIDGGMVKSNQLYNILLELAPDPSNITITAWYISHTHGDHQQTLLSFLKSRYENVKIESILYNYTTTAQYNAITTGADGVNTAKNFESTLISYVGKDTKKIKPHTGQIYNYGSAKVEIMYTVEDVLPKTLDYLNTSSMVVRVTIGDHSMLALTDTTHVSGDILKNMYGSYLESDMVQLAHHGTYPGYASLYHAIKAPILIWPSNMQNVTEQISNSAVVAAISYATDIYVANAGTITLALPYTPINNKQEFLDSLGG